MQGTLTLDVTGLAIHNIKQTRKTEKRSAWLVKCLNFFLSSAFFISPRFTPKIVSRGLTMYVNRQSLKVAHGVIFFKGAARDLQTQIEATAVLPPTDFARKIEAYRADLRKRETQGREVLEKVRTCAPLASVAEAMDRFLMNHAKLSAAVEMLHFVAVGHALEEAQQRAAFSHLRARIQSNDTSDIDPEMLALAASAMEASDGRDLALDPDWSRRMTQGPVH